jgi:hypothetical protein
MKRKTIINAILAASVAPAWLLVTSGCSWHHDDHYDARDGQDREVVRPVIVQEEVRPEIRHDDQPEVHLDVRP